MLGGRLNTIHNLHFYQKVMQDLRDAIDNDCLEEHVAEFYAKRGMEVPALK